MLNLKNGYFTGKDEFPVLQSQNNNFNVLSKWLDFLNEKVLH